MALSGARTSAAIARTNERTLVNFSAAFREILLDLLSTILFLGTIWLTGDLVLAIAVAMAAGAARIAFLKLRRRPVSPLLWLALGLVVVFGTATIFTRDPRFIMMKPSLVFFAVSVVMFTTRWLEPYLPFLVRVHVSAAIISRVSQAWAAVVFALGVGNAIAAMNLGIKAWSIYAGVVPTFVQLVSFAATYLLFRWLVDRGERTRPAPQSA